jgi:hypothetical protein
MRLLAAALVVGAIAGLSSSRDVVEPAGTANVTGYVMFAGQPFTHTLAPDAQITPHCETVVGTSYDNEFRLGNDGSYALTVPGDTQFAVYVTSQMGGEGVPFGQSWGSIPEGTTGVLDVDVTADAGIVMGSITVNGAALADALIMFPSLGIGGSCLRTDGTGAYKGLLPPGTHIGGVRTPGNVLLGPIALTAPAGQTMNAGASDFTAGGVHGTLLWNGSAIDARSTIAPCGLGVRAGALAATVSADATYSIPMIAPGTYAPVVGLARGGSVTAPPVTIGGVPVQHDIALEGQLARVEGTVTSGGVPIAHAFLDIDQARRCAVADGSGRFSTLLPPGDYEAAVRTGEQTDAIGKFSFSVAAAGDAVDLGSVEIDAVDAQDAVVQGRVLFNGAPFEPIGDSCGLIAGIWTYDYEQALGSDGAFEFRVPVRSVMGHAYVGTAMQGEGVYFGEGPVPLVGGLTAQHDIEIGADAGIVEGSVTVNGERVQAHVTVPLTGHAISGACFMTDADGNFRAVLPPGMHTLTFRTLSTTFATAVVTVTTGARSTLDVNVPCPDGGAPCVSGFWMGELQGFGRCSFALLQASGGSVSGSVSCTRGHGSASGAFDGVSQRLLLTANVHGSPPVSIDALHDASSGTLSGDWGNGAGSGALSLERAARRAMTYVDAGHGGVLTTSIGDAISVPAGALGSDRFVEASIETLPVPQPPGYGAVSYAYELAPDGLSFNTPAEATFGFDAAALADEGLDVSGLALFVLEDGAWEPLPSIVDVDGQSVSVELEHFSQYALLAPLAVEPTPTATTTPSPESTPTWNATATPNPATATTTATPDAATATTTATPGATASAEPTNAAARPVGTATPEQDMETPRAGTETPSDGATTSTEAPTTVAGYPAAAGIEDAAARWGVTQLPATGRESRDAGWRCRPSAWVTLVGLGVVGAGIWWRRYSVRHTR